jgi:hypothetical protein
VAAWPTPGSNDFKGSVRLGQRRGQLDEAAAWRFPSFPPARPTAPPGPPSSPPGPTSPPLWQTPATDSFRSRGGERKDEQGLDQQARGFWPTPCANDDNKSPEAHMAMKRRMPGGERHTITSLQVAVKALSPGEKRRLNPRFVAWLMGLPPGWLDAQSSCGPAEMASYRSRLRSHLACLLDESVSTLAAD